MRNIRILALGDVVGTRAVEILSKHIPILKETLSPDIIIVNGENSSDRGIGITEKEYKLLISSGVDVITTGNHVWNKKEVYKFINEADRLLRPLNYHPSLPGRGTTIVSVNGLKVAVVNVIGSVIMDAPFISPFYSIENEVNRLREETNLIMVDFHAEATAEKVLMGWFLDGKVSLVFGTHTHIQTADEKILPNGTGYITDIGMCGFQRSVIGSKIDQSMKRIVNGIPERLDPSTEGDFQINGIIADIDTTSGKTVSIRRLNLSLPNS